MKKARLLFTEICNRNCAGCCNKNWTGAQPKEITFEELLEFDEINITGGEPMLYPDELIELITKLKFHKKTIFLYTALPLPLHSFYHIIAIIDGVSLTLHNWKDYRIFKYFNLDKIQAPGKQLRLNTFPKIKFKSTIWDVRPKHWIKDCPLPAGEILVKLK